MPPVISTEYPESFGFVKQIKIYKTFLSSGAEPDIFELIKVVQFELDPCGAELVQNVLGANIGRGNCSMPNVCTCLLKKL